MSLLPFEVILGFIQDTRELLLVVDVDKEDHADDVGEILETTELNFMSPQLCKRLLRKAGDMVLIRRKRECPKM